MDVKCMHHGHQRRSQFEHYQALMAIALPSYALILFGDDDDLWCADRVATYAALSSSMPDDADGLSLEWASMPCDTCVAQELGCSGDSETVDELLRRGHASVECMSVYWMIACRLKAVCAFFDACAPPLVQSKFCDIAFKNFMLERRKCVRLSRKSEDAQSLLAQGRWLMYYDNVRDNVVDDSDEDEPELRACTSPSLFFRGSGAICWHASDIHSCSPEQAESQLVARELHRLHRLNGQLADRGADMVARHLARHRTRIEKESAGWFGLARPPSRGEVETLFAQIERGSGGTSALAALIDSMQCQAVERSNQERIGTSGARWARYVSYDDFAELERASSEISAAEQAVAFDCLLLRAAQPLRKILQRFGMDARPADLFEAQLEKTWESRCQHLFV